MLRFWRRVVLAAVCCAGAAADAPAQTEATGSVRIVLADSRGAPVRGVVARLYLVSDTGTVTPERSWEAATNSRGVLVIDGVPAGSYHGSLEAPGYDVIDFARLDVGANETTSLKFMLDPTVVITFRRFGRAKIEELEGACVAAQGGETITHGEKVFDAGKDWERLWSKYHVRAPAVDFTRFRVAAVFLGLEGHGDYVEIVRVTYTPHSRTTTVYYASARFGPDTVSLAVMSCEMDMVLIKSRPGTVKFRQAR
jgi:hypothetical protein